MNTRYKSSTSRNGSISRTLASGADGVRREDWAETGRHEGVKAIYKIAERKSTSWVIEERQIYP